MPGASSADSTPASPAQPLPQNVLSRPSSSSNPHELWLAAAAAVLAALLRFAVVWYAIAHYGAKMIYGGFETAFVGAALASGHGFSSLYGLPNGPTAHFAPLYPLLVGLVFRCFHSFSVESAWVLCTFNLVCESLIVLLVYWIGRRCFAPMVAFASALLWAIQPATVAYSVQIWYSSISALLATLAVASYLYLLDARPRRRDCLGYGLLWGVAALTNTTLVLIMPPTMAGLLYRWGRQLWRDVIAGGLVFFLLLAPWMTRNYIVFHQFIPIRGNFGPTLWYGNRPDVKGPDDESLNPTQNWDELQAYQRLGDRGYAGSRQKLALEIIRQNPRRFAHLTWNRVLFFWAGIRGGTGKPALAPACWSILAFAGLAQIMRRSWLRAIAFAAAILLFPLPYYITVASLSYRYPINPLVNLLAVQACFTLAEWVLRSPSTDTSGPAPSGLSLPDGSSD